MSVEPDTLAELEEQRRVLMRSLRDLDLEREAGDVDDDDYETLRDDYTVRAADVLRAIDDQKVSTRGLPRRSLRSLALIAAVVLVAAVGAGLLVARSSGQRLPGQVATGGITGADEVPAILVDARTALGAGDLRRAADQYGSVLAVEPNHPEALAYVGWLTALAANETEGQLRAEGLARGKERLRQSIAADSDYADPHCFLAVIAAQWEDDQAGARREGRRCVALDPPTQMRALVAEYVDGVDVTSN
ncbi:hypothetical protein BH24ACT6_BH24ACT6_01440 [soil metagenome]